MIALSPPESLPGLETQETLLAAVEDAGDALTRVNLDAPLDHPEDRALLSALERFLDRRGHPGRG